MWEEVSAPMPLSSCAVLQRRVNSREKSWNQHQEFWSSELACLRASLVR